ncbi:MAG: tRNA (adenosine(37)-N6)-threonylcarbamoyltransferase complex ATPase subunit type 1 TsaE [Lachnospiraceae bacterium]|nr:tRNA (adenosine(37)-N6)-threonylcarbamoyltransferase complex ATPase subunit type 1 TsaE [Lachnospiraceae bacterium]
MTTVYETYQPEETYEIARKCAEALQPGDVLCLNGELGVGKTVFAKGLAAGLGVTEDVVSPTFTILKEYTSGRLPFYHFDVYRIDDPDEMTEVGFEEYLYGCGVSVIEWSMLIAELIPKEAIRVTIEKAPEKGMDYRRITVSRREVT